MSVGSDSEKQARECYEFILTHMGGNPDENKKFLFDTLREAIQRAEQRVYKGGWADSTNRHEVMDDRHFYHKGLLRGAEICENIHKTDPLIIQCACGEKHYPDGLLCGAEAIRKEANASND